MPADTVTMSYGTYYFSPVPLVTISRATNKASNRPNPIGYTYRMTLNGVLTPIDPDNTSATTGFNDCMDMKDDLEQAMDEDCKQLTIFCGPTIEFQARPRILSLSFGQSTNNWVNTIPFTIELEYDRDLTNEHPGTNEHPPYIESYTEEWNFEFDDSKKYFTWDLSTLTNQDGSSDYSASDSNNPFEARVTHAISIVGKKSCGDPKTGPSGASGFKSGVENAREWLDYNLSWGTYDPLFGHAQQENVMLGTGDTYGVYDHIRAHSINEAAGSINFTESWLITGNNTGINNRACSEQFNVNIVQSAVDSRVRVSVEGTIQGFEERTYSSGLLTPVTGTAYSNAESSWSELSARVFPRAQKIFQGQGISSLLNPNPLSKTIGHSPHQGTITYNYEFDNRPCSFISGSLSEIITIVDNYPSDVFASLPVLGRAQGPILQEISTYTSPNKQVTIEVVMPQPTGCETIADLELNNPSGEVESLLCQFETQLSTANDQVFKDSDSSNWNPLTGRYSRAVSWTYAKCSGSLTSTLC